MEDTKQSSVSPQAEKLKINKYAVGQLPPAEELFKKALELQQSVPVPKSRRAISSRLLRLVHRSKAI